MRGQGQNVGPLETSQILSVTLTEGGTWGRSRPSLAQTSEKMTGFAKHAESGPPWGSCRPCEVEP